MPMEGGHPLKPVIIIAIIVIIAIAVGVLFFLVIRHRHNRDNTAIPSYDLGGCHSRDRPRHTFKPTPKTMPEQTQASFNSASVVTAVAAKHTQVPTYHPPAQRAPHKRTKPRYGRPLPAVLPAAHLDTVLTTVLIIIATVLYATFIWSNSSNRAIVDATVKFIAEVQANGRITDEQYAVYMDSLGWAVDVDIQATRNDTGIGIIEGSDIILAALANEQDSLATDSLAGVYALSPGDDIQVTVRRSIPNVYDWLGNALSGNKTSDASVITVKGGIVRYGSGEVTAP